MTSPIRIANCSGFYGDRISAAREMVEGGPIDVLTGDWLAELTMLILARTQAKRPGSGYARTFVTQMDQVMGACLDKGIKVVTNAGGLDPESCAEAVAEVAAKLGLSPTIAYVNGDNLIGRLDRLELHHFETGEPLTNPDRFISANAYLGGWGIVEALNMGADIVITGRATDAAVVMGPAAWHHGWARDDWDQMAGAVVAGHVIECGTQATGGNYSYFTEVANMHHLGFPWADIAADGSCVIGKHDDGTGGEVSVGTVTSQLLYEIGGPAYLGPDVTSRFDTVELEQVGPDRVQISGTKGEPPPPTLKVAMNEIAGYRQDLSVALTGLDIEAKAQLVESEFWAFCPTDRNDFDSVTSEVVRTDKADPDSNDAAQAHWRLTLKDADERKVGRSVSDAMTQLALASIPGFTGSGMATGARPYGVYTPATIDASLVPQHVVVLGGERTVVESTSVSNRPAPDGVRPHPSHPDGVRPHSQQSASAPLGRVCAARSGDKGGNANLGVFTRSADAFAWLDDTLTVERLKELLPEAAGLRVERHRFPNLRSLNFVIHGFLQEGVAASTRSDAQAKSLGEWLRARYVDIPTSLLETSCAAQQ